MNRLALLSALSLLFLGQGCWLLCIAEGSSISTPTGRCRIEQLREGDAVYSVDTRSGALVEVRITAIRRGVRECMSLELRGGERLRCTPSHPIYHPDTDSYRVAGEWITHGTTTVARVVEGRVIHQAVASVSAYVGLMEVFDLSVDGPHSNFIADGVVVHNKSPGTGSDYGVFDNDSDSGTDTDDWLDNTAEIPCDDATPAGQLCLTIQTSSEFREYQLDVGSAAINGAVLTMVFESSQSPDSLPRLSVTYPADATMPVSCEDADPTITIEFSGESLSTVTSCLLNVGEAPASPGGTISGTMSANLVRDGVNYLVMADWVDVPVDE